MDSRSAADLPGLLPPRSAGPGETTDMNGTPQHVIFGTGAIGLATLDALRRRGEDARLINRSGHADVPDGVEVIGGDARDAAFAAAVTKGATRALDDESGAGAMAVL
jgi:hypothetical protein